MPKALPYYPLYVYDFDEDPNVLAMNLSEVGLYQLALNEAWKRGSIPDDPAALANLIRRPVADVKRAWFKVQACWTSSSVAGRLVNPRQEKERTKIDAISEARSVAAKISHLPSANAECLQDALHGIRGSGSESVSDSGSRFSSSIQENASTRAGDKLDPETILRLWCNHRGFKKPQRGQRARILERLGKLEMSEAEVAASLNGFFASDWGRTNGYPIFGWLKDPFSWISEEVECAPSDPVVSGFMESHEPQSLATSAVVLPWQSDQEYQDYLGTRPMRASALRRRIARTAT